ncbi:hypothetical protein [Deinococcus sonorensis]|uniref:Uncharacterized protein n=2 Tax=Deinococcus sonorensis TaxID=309891 RepID=A0AAU7UC26_9DEIO
MITATSSHHTQVLNLKLNTPEGATYAIHYRSPDACSASVNGRTLLIGFEVLVRLNVRHQETIEAFARRNVASPSTINLLVASGPIPAYPPSLLADIPAARRRAHVEAQNRRRAAEQEAKAREALKRMNAAAIARPDKPDNFIEMEAKPILWPPPPQPVHPPRPLTPEEAERLRKLLAQPEAPEPELPFWQRPENQFAD